MITSMASGGVAFHISAWTKQCEVVQSREVEGFALRHYGFVPGEGLYTDMNAIRRDEDLDNLHSIYVDQWDRSRHQQEDRTLDTLMRYVEGVYRVFRQTEDHVAGLYPSIVRHLPERISFITAQQLEDAYPGLAPRDRESAYAREKGAICVMQIGGSLRSGVRHDGRAPDYDDWRLNADIVLYYPVLDCAMELSSMGIRVDERSLAQQLKLAGAEDRSTLAYHADVLAGRLPTPSAEDQASRLCM